MVARRPPSPALAPFVECLWASERPALAHARERSLPTGCADIVIPLLQPGIVRFDGTGDRIGTHLAGGVLQGAGDACVVRGGTDAPSAVVGVHFKPGGALRFAGLAMRDLSNRTVTLEDAWGAGPASTLRERLQAEPAAAGRLATLEAALRARLAHAPRRRHAEDDADRIVAWAVARIDAAPAVARVAPLIDASGWSHERFIARFAERVGLTPKRYCRVRRFQQVLQRIAGGAAVDWAQLALDAGFGDQAHLIHEFKRFAGVSPGAYRAVAPDQPNHVAIADEAAPEKSTRRRAPAGACWAPV